MLLSKDEGAKEEEPSSEASPSREEEILGRKAEGGSRAIWANFSLEFLLLPLPPWIGMGGGLL